MLINGVLTEITRQTVHFAFSEIQKQLRLGKIDFRCVIDFRMEIFCIELLYIIQLLHVLFFSL